MVSCGRIGTVEWLSCTWQKCVFPRADLTTGWLMSSCPLQVDSISQLYDGTKQLRLGTGSVSSQSPTRLSPLCPVLVIVKSMETPYPTMPLCSPLQFEGWFSLRGPPNKSPAFVAPWYHWRFVSLRLLTHSIVFIKPSSISTLGRYPRSFLAFSILARLSRTSPGRSGP